MHSPIAHPPLIYYYLDPNSSAPTDQPTMNSSPSIPNHFIRSVHHSRLELAPCLYRWRTANASLVARPFRVYYYCYFSTFIMLLLFDQKTFLVTIQDKEQKCEEEEVRYGCL